MVMHQWNNLKLHEFNKFHIHNIELVGDLIKNILNNSFPFVVCA